MANRPETLTHFDQLGAYLALKTDKAIEQEDLPFVRQWLDDAPTHASPGSMASWGQLMSSLVKYLSNEWRLDKEANEPDHSRLGAYLNAMRALEPAVWWLAGPIKKHESVLTGTDRKVITRPVYESFHDLCYSLADAGLKKSNTLLKKLVEEAAWEPTPLLTALESMRARQLKFVNDSHDWNATIRNTAQGQFLCALRPLVLDTTWRPEDTAVYGDTWLSHDNASRHGNLEQAQRGREFVQRFAKSTPSQTDKMLSFILSSTDLIEKDMPDFFPLRLADCDAHATLHALVGILKDTEHSRAPEKARTFAARLQGHHTELHQLLTVHLSLFPDANKVDSHASVLVAGFDALRGKATPTLAIPTDAFDDSQVAPTFAL